MFISFEQSMKRQCGIIADIASNEEIVKYLDDWATENILDKGYTFVSGTSSVSAKKGNDFISITPLPNPNITNIELQYLRFYVYKKPGRFEDPITNHNVASFEFSRGRDTVIILKNGELLTSYRGHDLESGHLMKIKNNVYAYCANSKF